MTTQKKDSPSEQLSRILQASGFRHDGRRFMEPRDPKITFNVVPSSWGSVRYKAGGSEIIASVLSAEDTRSSHLATIEVAVLETIDLPLNISRSITTFCQGPLDEVLTRPVAVHMLVLSDDGSLQTVAVNAAVLALAHAGIPLLEMPVGVTLSLVRLDPSAVSTSDNIVVDPTTLEARELGSAMPVVCDSQGEVLAMSLATQTHPSRLSSLLQCASHQAAYLRSRHRTIMMGE
eukprot:gnl/Dysnectes_brevis/1921_a2206_1553.p1 GENE.gnl/Dysnectes_brevis/1921_a2206_1553~~gnl/Dysnectes_brevis/1921_a2206_1553.p1  ORF type:complete len:233 (-),score=58.39 gnl/Dysnectes_brevis/1921_a2206_1553:59-757(-)